MSADLSSDEDLQSGRVAPRNVDSGLVENRDPWISFPSDVSPCVEDKELFVDVPKSREGISKDSDHLLQDVSEKGRRMEDQLSLEQRSRLEESGRTCLVALTGPRDSSALPSVGNWGMKTLTATCWAGALTGVARHRQETTSVLAVGAGRDLSAKEVSSAFRGDCLESAAWPRAVYPSLSRMSPLAGVVETGVDAVGATEAVLGCSREKLVEPANQSRIKMEHWFD